MGVAEMRDAFNAVAMPRFTCERVLMRYSHRGGLQMQILSFSGTGADGKAFDVASDALPPDTDVNLAAAAVAQTLLKRDSP